MIEVLSGILPGENPLLEQAFRLRHEVFVEERGWEALRRPDRREIDQFDDADAVHHLALEGGRVVGYTRMRPTSKPHLLADIHRHLCQRDYPRSASLWEWTRYCVHRDRRGGSVLGDVGAEIMGGAVEWCLDHNIEDAILEMHPVWIAYLTGVGFDVRPLGLPTELEGTPVIAVQIHFSDKTVDLMREMRGMRKSVVAGDEDYARVGRG